MGLKTAHYWFATLKKMVALHESLILYFSISALNGDSEIELDCSSIVVAVHSCIGATPENRSGGIHIRWCFVLGGGFKCFLCSFLFGEDSQFD